MSVDSPFGGSREVFGIEVSGLGFDPRPLGNLYQSLLWLEQSSSATLSKRV